VLPALVPDLGVGGLDAEEKISRNLRCYRDDPLVYRGRIRARTGAEILAVMQRPPGALPPLSVPLVVLHGIDGQICSLAGSVMVHEAVSSADKIPRRYPGLYHRVFNEPEREQILTDIIFWLTAHGSALHSAG
jgi:acylglycerol lipase